MYVAAKRSVSSLLNLLSAGIHGNVVFNLQNALLKMRILALSRALAAFRGARLSMSSFMYFSSEGYSSNDDVEARRFRGILLHQQQLLLIKYSTIIL